jgi:DNA-binding transcriptional LysR family regulator
VPLRARPAITSSDFAFLRACVLTGSGIGMVPVVLVAKDLADGAVVRVLGNHCLGGAPLYLLYPGTRFLPSKIRVFRDFLLEYFGVPPRARGS